MKPKILFIILPYMESWGDKPETKLRAWLALPYGALSVATYCKSEAKIRILDCNVCNDYLAAVRREMQEKWPDIVAFSMTFDVAYKNLRRILSVVMEEKCLPWLFIGGAATLASYRDILVEQPVIDAVCYGDGERPMMDFLVAGSDQHNFLDKHPSWITRESLKQGTPIVKTSVENLDDTLALDYDFINMDDYSLQEEFSPHAEDIKDKKRYYMLTSRGCPFRCAFCYKSRENDRKMRYASVDKVIDHTRYLIENYGMNILTFCDDQILFNMKRAKEIFRRLAPFHIRVEIYQGMSVNFIDEEMAQLMAEAGMVRTMLNVESGSQTMLNLMIEKPVSLDKAKDTIQILRKYGIWTSGIFVVGFPGETDELRRETMDWIADADLDWCVFNPCIPIRGTKLYDICIENGYILPDKLGTLDYGNYTIEVPGYPAVYVADQIYKMNLEANFVNNRSMRVGDYKTAATMFRQVISLSPFHAFAHYYLAECLLKMGDEIAARFELNAASGLLYYKHPWGNYAQFFGIGG